MKTYFGTVSSNSTVNIAHLGFKDASEYFVIANARGTIWDTSGSGSGTSHGGYGTVMVTQKTANSFRLESDRNVSCSYQIVYVR